MVFCIFQFLINIFNPFVISKIHKRLGMIYEHILQKSSINESFKNGMSKMELNSLQGNILVLFIKQRAKDKRTNGHICIISNF